MAIVASGPKLGAPQKRRSNDHGWDPSFPLENPKSPHPENPGKLLKHYKFGPQTLQIWPAPGPS